MRVEERTRWIVQSMLLVSMHCSTSSNATNTTSDDASIQGDVVSQDTFFEGGFFGLDCNVVLGNEDGIMVSKGAPFPDDTLCGTKEVPCSSVGYAIQRARVHPKKRVFVAAGEYEEAGLQLEAGVTIQGGAFTTGLPLHSGEVGWKQVCPFDPTLVVVKVRHSLVAMKAELSGIASLDSLMIRNETRASSGETLYGLQALGSNTIVSLRDVFMYVSKGGDGAPAVAGGDGSDKTICNTTSSAKGASGVTGSPGMNAPQGRFENGFYLVPSLASRGSDGTNGDEYTPTQGECFSEKCYPECTLTLMPNKKCTQSRQLQCAPDGKGGCGGEGGKGGAAGQSGGSSIGVIASDGAVVRIERGGVKVDDGGKGSNGALGGTGGKGGEGFKPGPMPIKLECIASCDLSIDPGPPKIYSCESNKETKELKPGDGGNGGKGGNGGQGGGGSGGFSVAVVKAGLAKITLTNAYLAHGLAGSGGIGGAGVAPAGIAADQYP